MDDVLYTAVRTAAWRYLHDRSVRLTGDREDLADEVVARFWEVYGRRVTETGEARSISYIMAHNAYVTYCRKWYGRVKLRSLTALEGTSGQLMHGMMAGDEVVDETPLLDRLELSLDIEADVVPLLRQLRGRERASILEPLLEGTPYAELAAKWGVRETNIRVTRHRALRKVRKWLDAKRPRLLEAGAALPEELTAK